MTIKAAPYAGHERIPNRQRVHPPVRQRWPDVCRVISVFAVVLLHVTAERLVWDRTHGTESILVLAIRTIPSFAVPCFFMLSGMFWLSREKTATPRRMLRRTLLLFVAWIAWTAIYSALPWPHSFIPFLKRLAHPPRHLWFLPAIMSCYLMAPALQTIARDREVERFSLIAVAFLLFLPSAGRSLCPNLASGIPAISEIASLSFPAFYFLLGDWLAGIPSQRLRRYRALIPLSGAGCLAMTFLLAAFGRIHHGELAAFVRPDHLFVAGYSVSVFLLFKTADAGQSSPEWLVRISRLCFGIYLVHPFFIFLVHCGPAGPVGFILVKSLVVFACSMVATLILRLLHPLRLIT